MNTIEIKPNVWYAMRNETRVLVLSVFGRGRNRQVRYRRGGKEPNIYTRIRRFAGLALYAERTCRGCHCTDRDCSQCIKKTGSPCSWVEADLCSACEAA